MKRILQKIFISQKYTFHRVKPWADIQQKDIVIKEISVDFYFHNIAYIF